MPILELFILTIILVVISILALAVRMIFTKKGEFRGRSCQSGSDKLKDQEIGCGCGGGSCETIS